MERKGTSLAGNESFEHLGEAMSRMSTEELKQRSDELEYRLDALDKLGAQKAIEELREANDVKVDITVWNIGD